MLRTSRTKRRLWRPLRAKSVGTAVVAASLLTPTVPCLAAELFGPRISVPVGDDPSAMIVGDFNGDGHTDVAVTLRCCHVGVLLGDGLGGLFAVDEVFVSAGLDSIAAGDFDRDGDSDLAVVSSVHNSVSILVGNGQGRFFVDREIAVGGRPKAIATGDFDSDDKVDLAVAVSVADAVSLLFGDGHGGFGSGPAVPVGDNPWALAVADFNADGHVDLAAANNWGSSVSIRLGDGTGAFEQGSDIVVGEGPQHIATGDFDRNGLIDLAVANYGSDNVSVLLGDPAGGFTTSRPLPLALNPVTRLGPTWIEAADLNFDGYLDLVVVNLIHASVSVLRGGGEGVFAGTDVPDLRDIGGPRALAAGEFDGDGFVDLLVAHTNRITVVDPHTGAVTLIPGDGLGGFVAVPRYPGPPFGGFGADYGLWDGGGEGHVLVTDLDGDGHADLAVAGSDLDVGSVVILRGNGSGDFAFSARLDLPGATWQAAADFDDDGAMDLAVTQAELIVDQPAGTMTVLRGDGAGGFGAAEEISVGRSPNWVAALELNGDDAIDLVTVNGFGSLSVVLGERHGGFRPQREISACGSAGNCGCTGDYCAVMGAVGDFNGDGAADLAVTVDPTVNILLGDGAGGFELRQRLSAPLRPMWIWSSHLNADGHADLVSGLVDRPDRNMQLRSWFGDGSGEFRTTGPDVSVPPFLSGTLADFNADGAIDLALPVVLTHTVALVLGDPTGGFLPTSLTAVGWLPLQTASGDFDEDGHVDIAVAALRRREIDILLNRLDDRADVNGSNRIDGFDTNAIGRTFSRKDGEPGYRRNFDVNLDRIIDGEDLGLVGDRFGLARRSASPLRARLVDSSPTATGTVTFQASESRGDLLTVEVTIEDAEVSATGAQFGVTFGSNLELAGHEQGTYFEGGLTQWISVEQEQPGYAEIGVWRYPGEDRASSGRHSLVGLIFRARSEGTAPLDFVVPEGRSRACLLDAAGREIPAVHFVGPASVVVDSSTAGAAGQRLGLTPDELVIGPVAVGTTARRPIRLANHGFSELAIGAVEIDPPLPEFRTHFTSPFAIPPFSAVDLVVEFAPSSGDGLSTRLVVFSNDPQGPHAIPLYGTVTESN